MLAYSRHNDDISFNNTHLVHNLCFIHHLYGLYAHASNVTENQTPIREMHWLQNGSRRTRQRHKRMGCPDAGLTATAAGTHVLRNQHQTRD